MSHPKHKRHHGKDEARRQFVHGSSGATADMASDPKGSPAEHRRPEASPVRSVKPDPEGEKHDHLEGREAENRQEALIDEALEESFPASDPISAKRIT